VRFRASRGLPAPTVVGHFPPEPHGSHPAVPSRIYFVGIPGKKTSTDRRANGKRNEGASVLLARDPHECGEPDPASKGQRDRLPRSGPIVVAVFEDLSLLGGSQLKQAETALGQSHVTIYTTNPRSAHLATEAMLDRALIAIGGDIDEEIETVTGFVQSIEEDADAVPRRWRITILENHTKRSGLVVSFLRP